jgi:hypothetical protein
MSLGGQCNHCNIVWRITASFAQLVPQIEGSNLYPLQAYSYYSHKIICTDKTIIFSRLQLGTLFLQYHESEVKPKYMKWAENDDGDDSGTVWWRCGTWPH